MTTRRATAHTSTSVEVSPEAYAMLQAIARESRRSQRDILTMAIRTFAAATRHIHTMHPAPLSKSPQTPAQIQHMLSQARDKCSAPVSLASILTQPSSSVR